MKRTDQRKRPGKREYQRFYEALLALRSARECRDFLEDLCTPAELEAMVDRWRAVDLLKSQMTYREISEKTGMSVTTVGRVARCLEMGAGGYDTIYRRLDRKGSRP